MLDTQFMVVHIPQDKLHDIQQIINKMVKNRNATSWELQSLVRKLNFIMKAVPTGKCFSKRIYQVHAGVPHHHHHVDLHSCVLLDLWMWKVFLTWFRGWTPIVDNRILHANAVELFADASGSSSLGWGAWLLHLGLWMYGAWEMEFFEKFQPSIDFMPCWQEWSHGHHI